ncbi:MAG: DUF2723 domain-containing protein [Chloroflexi bacterium]|nr:DUF2723 domain-containing protein [Chloroflexota bacterium]
MSKRALSGRRAEAAVGILLLLLALLLYLTTLDDGLELRELRGGDLITHQYAQVQARPANAPGYPLYTMGGWLWFRLGKALLGRWLNPTAVLSLYSTFWALAALWVCYALALGATGRRPLLAALPTAFLACTYFFWYYAVTTEQYASVVLQTLVMVWLAFRWQQERRDRWLAALAFACGLSLAHMVTALLLAPALLWFVWRQEPGVWRRPRLLGWCAAAALLPLLAYLYVYRQGTAHPEWWGQGDWPNAWRWFVSFVSTGQGRSELTWTLGPPTPEFPLLVAREMTWPGLLAALAGILTLERRRAVLLLGGLALYLAFCYVDRHGNWYQVWMPMYGLLALGLAAGAGWARERLQQVADRRLSRMGQAALLAALLLLVGNRLLTNWPAADQRGREADDGLWAGQAILADGPAERAGVFGQTDELLSLQYVTQIWGQRPDVRPLGAVEAAAELEAGETLYVLAGALPLLWAEVSADARLTSAGLILAQASAAPISQMPSPGARPLQQAVGEGMRMLAYQVRPACALPEATRRYLGVSADPGVVHLTLWWQRSGSLVDDASLSLRATRGGQLVFVGAGLVQHDQGAPVWGHWPPSRWAQGEVVRDDYLLPFAEAWPYDGLAVVPYRVTGRGFVELAGAAWPLAPREAACER